MLTACGSKENWKKELEDAGTTVHVTYDANGGLFDKYRTMDVYISPGAPIPNVETTPKLFNPVLAGYFVEGWYYASYDSEGNLVLSDRRVDFSDCRTDTDVVVAPKWEEEYQIRFYEGDGKTVALQYSVRPSTSYEKPALSDPVKDGYTFLGDYVYDNADVSGDKVVTFPLTYDSVRASDADGDRVVSLHPAFLENVGGKPWVIVRTKTDLAKGTNYYLLADLDFTNDTPFNYTTWAYRFRGTDGVLEGNGHTIRGLRVAATPGKNDKSCGLFPESAFGEIRNVTFENCAVKADFTEYGTGGPDYFVAFLFGRTENTVLSGVTFTGCTLNVICDGEKPPLSGALIADEESTLTKDGLPVLPDTPCDGITVAVETP